MKELYTSPKAEIIVFDKKDVITTSGPEKAQSANSDLGWTGFFEYTE